MPWCDSSDAVQVVVYYYIEYTICLLLTESGYASVTVTAGPGPGRFGNVWKPGQSTVHPLRPVLYIYLPTPAQLRSST